MDSPAIKPVSITVSPAGDDENQPQSAKKAKKKSAKAVLETAESNLSVSNKKSKSRNRTKKRGEQKRNLVPKLSSSSSGSEKASSNDEAEEDKRLSDDDDNELADVSNHRLGNTLLTAKSGTPSETSLKDEFDATFLNITRAAGGADEQVKEAIKWATDHPLTEAMHIEQALQVMLDDIRGRMGQDVEYESLPLRAYFRRGFACSHRATQTEASDIIDLEGLMKCARQLRADLTDVRRELELQIALIRTDMEHRMKEMFALMFREATKQDKIGEQKRRRELERMRKGMRQQLKNAVEGVKKWYIDYYEEILKRERASRVNNTVGRERFDDLQRLVAVRDEELLKLRNKTDEYKREIEQLQTSANAGAAGPPARASPVAASFRSSMNAGAAASRPSASLESAAAKSKEQSGAELESLRAEVENFKTQSQKLLTELQTVRKEASNKSDEILALQGKLDEAMGAAGSEEQQARAAALAAEAQLRKEKQRQQTAMEELQRQAREEQLRLARQAQQERASMAQAANMRYSDWLANYVLDIDGRQVPLREVTEELRRRFQIEQQLREEIALLTREAQRLNKTWANKFAILRSSQAALRNEMYLRRLIERKMEPYLDQDNWVCTPREQQLRMVDSFAAAAMENSENGQREIRKQKLSTTRNAEPFLALGPVPPAVRVNYPYVRNTSQQQTTKAVKKSSVAKDLLSVATVRHEAIAAGGDNLIAALLPPQLQSVEFTSIATYLADCAVQTDDDVVLLPDEPMLTESPDIYNEIDDADEDTTAVEDETKGGANFTERSDM